MSPCRQFGHLIRRADARRTELEAELPYALTRVVDDITEALQRRSFLDRITQQLDEPGARRGPENGA